MSGDPSSAAAFDSREYRRALGQFATGVTIVTCLDETGGPVGMTANSFASVSLDPPLVLWSIDRKARSFAAFERAERLAFSVLAQDQVELSNRFAKPGADKFATVAWEAGLAGVPLMPGAAAHFECSVHQTFDGGDHLVMIGRVERFHRHERRSLAFAQGRYGTIAPHPGPAAIPVDDVVAARHPYDDFLVPLLFRAYNHVFKAFAGSLADEDPTGSQMRILAILSASGPTAETPLLNRTMLSASRYEDARDRLLARGLVRAAEGGGLAITADGETMLTALLHRAVERERHSTASLDATEVEQLRTILKKLVLEHDSAAE
ncbi:flavin reductase family protein [Acuticoccus mangrovi]|uniref:Flavin reductase family protein n=1 Tax=Acuticoccus mangrovi TaxID=2796142 RepID=A0A934IU49_9HYPH|nr:flavin reductase family protein [Acuticoccus mangrovi]MBJ3778881.1 flavin reductase family protein [Acuticoccus mangrovi]